MITSVRKIGSRLLVVIPPSVARKMELAEGTVLHVTADAGAILMRRRPGRQRRSLSEIIARLSPAAYRKRSRERADGCLVGREVW